MTIEPFTLIVHYPYISWRFSRSSDYPDARLPYVIVIHSEDMLIHCLLTHTHISTLLVICASYESGVLNASLREYLRGRG